MTSSANIKVYATTIAKQELVLQDLTSLHITAGIDSPAVSFAATFAVESLPLQIVSIKVYDDSKLIFSGNIDNQKASISQNGMILQLDARNAGALLLDNQALPCVIYSANMTTVFNRFIAPHGFLMYNPRTPATLPMYTVRQGVCAWEAFTYFTRRLFGITPFVTAAQVNVQRRYTGKPETISNNGNGLRFTSISHELTPYNIISSVFLRDVNGAYSSVVNNSAAKRTNSTRNRYVIPSTEYENNSGLDANQRIRRSMFESEQVVVTLPNLVDAELGQEFEINDKLLKLVNLMVTKREHMVSENGAITRLTLASSIYYD